MISDRDLQLLIAATKEVSRPVMRSIQLELERIRNEQGICPGVFPDMVGLQFDQTAPPVAD